jgi:hypothetical protein
MSAIALNNKSYGPFAMLIVNKQYSRYYQSL